MTTGFDNPVVWCKRDIRLVVPERCDGMTHFHCWLLFATWCNDITRYDVTSPRHTRQLIGGVPSLNSFVVGTDGRMCWDFFYLSLLVRSYRSLLSYSFQLGLYNISVFVASLSFTITKNQQNIIWGKFRPTSLLVVRRLKAFSFRGLHPLTRVSALNPETVGTKSPDLRYRLALAIFSPKTNPLLKSWICPWRLPTPTPCICSPHLARRQSSHLLPLR